MAVDRHERSLNAHFVKQEMIEFAESQLPVLCSPFNLSTVYFLVHPHMLKEKTEAYCSRAEPQERATSLACCVNKLHIAILTAKLQNI